MSRYAELFDELRKAAKKADAIRVDPSHALERAAALEQLVANILWLNAQTIKELAKRDGVDVA